MSTEIFTTRFTIDKNHGHITARRQPGVFPNDTVGYFIQGTQVSGYVTFSNDDIWLQLTMSQYSGAYVALRYKGEVFADPLPVPPVPGEPSDLIYIKPDFLRRGISRPTYTNAKKPKPKSSEADYLAGKVDFVAELPMTVTVSGPDSSIMDNKYLSWIISIQPAAKTMTPPEILRNIAGLFSFDRAFNNHQYPQFALKQNKVVINNTIRIPPLICGAAYGHGMGSKTLKWGEEMYPVEIIDTSKTDYTKYNPTNRPDLFFIAKSSGRRPLFTDGIWNGQFDESIVQNMHWFNGSAILPFQGRFTNIGYINAAWVD